MRQSILVLFAFLLMNTWCTAQVGGYKVATGVPVVINGDTLRNPWVGGFNAPIFSEIDMNGDGIKDLFVFDHEGYRISTYINQGTPNKVDYVYAPEYKKKFPEGMHDWVLLKDYNCDGKEDIFTYSYSGGMTVYRNDYNSQTGLKFNLTYSLVNSKYGTITANLYVASVNLPALTDVDNDGDLDVLTFPVSGSFVEYHINKSVDLYGTCDSLKYELNPSCYGNFGLSGFANQALLNVGCRMADPGSPEYFLDPATAARVQHSGSCMIALDIDGDADKDLINGDILGNNLLLTINGGSTASALMTAQDDSFPTYDTPVNMITFPAPYYLDVNNDGKKDLVVAPCISGPSENYNNILYYQNTTNNTTNVFNYQKNRLLSDECIEVGSGTNVVFFDADGDGLTDILAGNYGYFNPTPPFNSGIAFYKNIGTPTAPIFKLITQDFAATSQLGIPGISPAFGDVDSDGDADLMVGNSDGTLSFFSNSGGNYTLTQPQVVSNTGATIDVGQFSTPQLYDVNKDGKLDLLIGERSGNLNYYENTGTAAAPVYTLSSANLGGVLVNNYLNLYGYSYPFMYDSSGITKLLVGSVTGYIYEYANIDNNLAGNFTLVDSIYYNIYEPQRLTVAACDIDGDGIREILAGNYAGGMTLYKYDSTSGVGELHPPAPDFTLYPNPVSSELIIRFETPSSQPREVVLYDITGKELMRQHHVGQVVVFQVEGIASGMYQCVVHESNGTFVKKVIVDHR